MATSEFDRTIPGQSLTSIPGNSPWEKPPQYTSLDKAMDSLMRNLGNEKKLIKMVVMLDNKVPVEALVRTILMSGFTEGKWTMDLAMLLSKPLAGMIITAYYLVRKKKPAYLTLDDYRSVDEDLALMIGKFEPSTGAAEAVKEAMPEVKKELPRSGLMGAV